jgi:hypothetical protein
MTLLTSVVEENNILCELHADTPSYVSDNNSEERKKVVNWRALVIKHMTYGVKLIKNQAVSLSLET